MANLILKEAAVYRSGCIMKKTAEVYLEAGTQTVCLRGLTQNMDQSSLRLSVPQMLCGSNVQVVFPTPDQQQEFIREKQQEMTQLEYRLALNAKQAQLWEQNADFSQKDSLDIAEMTAYLEQLPERLDALQQEAAELNELKKKLKKELDELKKEAQLPTVQAELTAPQAGTYPVEVSYRDYAASWYPAYEIHTDGVSENLEMRLRAKVSQNSGKDWENVKLTLFTGNPSVSGSVPVLDPTVVRFFVAPTVYKNRGRMLGATAKMAYAEEEAVECMEDSMPMMAMGSAGAPVMSAVNAGSGTATRDETMVKYELSGSWDIRDGQEIICDIEAHELGCEYQVIAVPKMDEGAFLAAAVKTAQLEDMEDTPAAVYLKGTFAGDVLLEPDMTEEEYQLSLGRDESVKVRRTQKKRYTSQILLKGQKKTEYEYEIAVNSRKEKSCKLVVKDQIPVSEEKSIVVDAADLGGGKLEEKTGLITWEFTLEPGETKLLHFAYSVAWPKDRQIEEVSI
ncbi:MAG: DUF4139 domain-containing protein [Lachnospiraceae bacterium]|nr:DUF4139 domain-containing protein [Lachnospiraceae bacterium]